MLGVSFGEVFIVVLVFFLITPTKDIPYVFLKISNFIRKIKDVLQTLKHEVSDIMEDENIVEIKTEINNMISDIDSKYNINKSDFLDKKNVTKNKNKSSHTLKKRKK